MERKSKMKNNAKTNFQSSFLDKGSKPSITLGNLRIAPYDVERILDVKINQAINEHGTLYFRGMLPAGQEERDIEAYTEGENIILMTNDSSGEHILFQGIIQEVVVKFIEHTYYIEVHAVSYSYLLDIEPRCYSFQNKKQTYSDLISQITSRYPDADVLDMASDGQMTNQFLMQYRETDWLFIKRLASHFNTGLIPDVRFDSPKYFFGIPDAPAVPLNPLNYTVSKDLKRFKQLSKNGISDLQENDFICYEVETNQALQVGDRVSFRERTYHVGSVDGRMEKGIFLNRYTLISKQGLSQPYQAHGEISGCSFNGRIIDIKNDRVKVHFDVDPSQDVETAHFFPYSTVYSSPDGSGWYAMPCKGDNVRIYFPDGDDSHAYAISSVHEPSTPPANHQASEGSGSSGGSGATPPPSGAARDNPDIKSLRHPSGKEITLTEDGIYITDGVGTVISITEEGVVIDCEKDIKFNSDQDIVMMAKEQIQFVAEESVEIYAGDTASIRLEEDVEIMGQEVKSN